MVVEVHQSRDLAEVRRFQVVENPLHDDPTHLPKHLLQIPLEGVAGDGRDGALTKSHNPLAKSDDPRQQLDGQFKKRGDKRASQ